MWQYLDLAAALPVVVDAGARSDWHPASGGAGRDGLPVMSSGIPGRPVLGQAPSPVQRRCDDPGGPVLRSFTIYEGEDDDEPPELEPGKPGCASMGEVVLSVHWPSAGLRSGSRGRFLTLRLRRDFTHRYCSVNGSGSRDMTSRYMTLSYQTTVGDDMGRPVFSVPARTRSMSVWFRC